MGQNLSEPVTAKETSSCRNDQLYVGSSSMQGWRVTMEDAHTHLLDLSPLDPDACFFAVYDGHGGSRVSDYASNHLHKRILSQESYQRGDIVESIKRGFLDLDRDMLNNEHMKYVVSGTTAITMLLKDNKMYVGNVGDSRAIACESGRISALSMDHKPNILREFERICAAGGWVEAQRVNGNLALSRALGDFMYKKNKNRSDEEQIVTALPDVFVKDVTEDLEFVVLACDGIWDVMHNSEVGEFIRTRIAKKMDPPTICEELMTRCLAPDCQTGTLGCDNMTVLLICFLHGKSYDDLATRCSRPKQEYYGDDYDSSEVSSTSSNSENEADLIEDQQRDLETIVCTANYNN